MDVVFMIVGVLLGYMVYAKGVKDGKSFAQNKKVEIIPKPIEAIKRNKENKKAKLEESAFVEEVSNMLDYDGFKQKVGE